MMTELEALLAGIVSEPLEETRWLVLADWLEEHDDPRRGELLRLHRKLLATCCEPDAYPERKAWQSRVVELIAAGVSPCVPRKTLVLPGGLPLTFAFVPPGSFLMGSNHPEGSTDEKPVHRVTLTKGFFLGVYPVTQEQWRAVMGKNPSHFKGDSRPVEQVFWGDCQEFCEKLGASQGRGLKVGLPTEAEWEWACRAGTTTEYHFGDVINTDLVNYNGNSSWNGSPEGKYREETTDVGSFACNAWGLCDLHGNVWEWCQDVYDKTYYQSSPTQDPICNNDQSIVLVLRGGSWDHDPVCCRAAVRDRNGPAYCSDYVGFRVCFRLD
ncbi:MAG: SUMF1/EgtB/PvdO family nonheme iron enzyme [Planctomycetes bacterium]|nr:SUMF1/EgtB/PvdO family nonheme iron enzyme [Planctomycetota bacterium]